MTEKRFLSLLDTCSVCGEYRGRTLYKGEPVDISCLCDGPLCRKCGKVRVHRPVSNYVNDQDEIWHVPYFCPPLCRNCR